MQLHKSIGAQFTFIAKLDDSRTISQTLSLVAGNDFAENFKYRLEDTPCADVSGDSTCIYPRQICHLYPKDQLLIDMGVDGYVGAPLHDSKGEVCGLVVALYIAPIKDAENVAALFELFAGRISAELERAESELALNELNQSLEQKVAYRTYELEAVIKQLKQSQKQLIEQEKLASLGRLVAGVAHEVNTPLGVAVLGTSTMISGINQLEAKLIEGSLSKQDLESFIVDGKESSRAVEFNLNRASELVANFKQMATDFHSDPKGEVNLSEWINSISTSLKPLLKKPGINLQLELPEKAIKVVTYPSRLAQVITNLVTNAINHAYPKNFKVIDKIITLKLTGNAKKYTISVSDNGIGMDNETQSKMFDPFYTTNRTSGGMGLGMTIVHNLVTSSLNGRFTIESQINKGSIISILFDNEDDDKRLLKNSFKRATQNSYQFYTHFHDSLTGSSDTIKQLFQRVDLKRQQTMVLQSINLFINNINTLEILFNSDSFKGIVKKHKGMGITNQLVVTWKECLINTIAQYDQEFDEKLEGAWDSSLSEFIDFFIEEINR
ncbi:ATP-binding protein [Pseudoalteromonas sp. H105]|uniref:ATP-binding protein n=1 Tax=Pseudoalteromonas sp. H105 TaxID=1348393 RepID=UPI001F3A12C9|nr:ATP-binding protein [Pseudoalteromonas sp. H105]